MRLFILYMTMTLLKIKKNRVKWNQSCKCYNDNIQNELILFCELFHIKYISECLNLQLWYDRCGYNFHRFLWRQMSRTLQNIWFSIASKTHNMRNYVMSLWGSAELVPKNQTSEMFIETQFWWNNSSRISNFHKILNSVLKSEWNSSKYQEWKQPKHLFKMASKICNFLKWH